MLLNQKKVNNMKLKIILLLLLSSVFFFGCASGQPQIVIETEQFEFGEVVNGEIVSKDLEIKNTGNTTLMIEGVSTSCGCTSATVDLDSLEPGQTTSLHIEFDSGAHGPELSGEFSRQIFIASNDPVTPEARIDFVANILLPEE